MLGVENLKKVIIAVLHLSNKVDEVTQDGFQVSDLIALLPNVVDGVNLIKSGKDALAEFKDLDEAEKEDILATVQEEFDIADDKLEAVVEQALKVVVEVSKLIKKVKTALGK